MPSQLLGGNRLPLRDMHEGMSLNRADALTFAQPPEFDGYLLAGHNERAIAAHEVAHHSFLVAALAGAEEQVHGPNASLALKRIQRYFGYAHEALIECRYALRACRGERDEAAAAIVLRGCFRDGARLRQLGSAFGGSGVVQLQHIGGSAHGYSGALAGEEQYPELVDASGAFIAQRRGDSSHPLIEYERGLGGQLPRI